MIVERQIRKKQAQVTLDLLRKGKLPDAKRVALDMLPFIAKLDGGATFKPRVQGYRKIWDFKGVNRTFDDILFDLEVLHEEVVEQIESALQATSRVDLSYNAQRQQIDALIGLLKNLAFVSKDTEDNFFGLFDTFTDLSKTNIALTTREAVDLNEACILLPQTDAIADRVDMSHLYAMQSWPILVTAPPTPATEPPEGSAEKLSPPTGRPGTAAVVVQNEPVPNAWFGFAFSDLVNSWRQIVTTSNGLGCTIEFVIPVAPADGSATITRVSMIPSSTSDVALEILHSLDNVNWLKFPGVPDQTVAQTGRTTNLDFETTRVRFLKFRVRLDRATEQDGASFHYIFGFKNIGLHKLGRVQQAEFFSTALTPTGMTKAIDKIALSVIESIPAGCDVLYYVAADDGSGSPRDGVWRPIQPITRAPLDGIPQVVKFSESAQKTVYIPSPDPSVIHENVREVDFYRVTEEVLEETPLFGQAFLFRGENAWWRNVQRDVITRQARDVFVDFNSGDVQKLYVVTTETADIASEVSALGTGLQTVLTVSYPVDFDPATMQVIPGPDVDPEVDQRPRYAIYRILRFRDSMVITNESVVLTGVAWSALGNDRITTEGTGRPTVTNSISTVTYTEGVDYILEEDGRGKLTGRLRRVQTSSVTSNINDGDTVLVTYELDPDVTELVSTIVGRKIFLARNLGEVPGQSFQVSYRFVPLPTDNGIKKSTLKVTSRYGQDEGTTYQEGRDYLVDDQRGTITRIPAGDIVGELVAFVDFRYEQTPKELDTFTTWLFVERRDPFTIDINPLGVDLEAGEAVLMDGIDVSRRTTWPEMTFGWHQVVVRSKRPEAFTGAAVRRVAELLDRNADPVFVAGGNFFSRMTANRIPLVQKSYTQLTKSTLPADHGFFAIDEGYVIVNFEPGSTEEVYSYGMRIVEGVLASGTWAEEFRLEYTYALDTASPVRKILLRASLTRGSDTDGGPTPKVFEYHGRVA